VGSPALPMIFAPQAKPGTYWTRTTPIYCETFPIITRSNRWSSNPHCHPSLPHSLKRRALGSFRCAVQSCTSTVSHASGSIDTLTMNHTRYRYRYATHRTRTAPTLAPCPHPHRAHTRTRTRTRPRTLGYKARYTVPNSQKSNPRSKHYSQRGGPIASRRAPRSALALNPRQPPGIRLDRRSSSPHNCPDSH
jgi:hypothetical protein